jgi:hypothetical protein
MKFLKPTRKKLILAIIITILCIAVLPFVNVRFCLQTFGGMGVIAHTDCSNLMASEVTTLINRESNNFLFPSPSYLLLLTTCYMILSYIFSCIVIYFTNNLKRQKKNRAGKIKK